MSPTTGKILSKVSLETPGTPGEVLTGVTGVQACIDGSMEMVSFLLEHQAGVNQADSEGWTPLHVAASCGYPDIAECVERSAALAWEASSASFDSGFCRQVPPATRRVAVRREL